jgi:glyceraldehyde-3-phosphate dehydrogenase/erythrose-4-phosphate dehydrogenase
VALVSVVDLTANLKTPTTYEEIKHVTTPTPRTSKWYPMPLAQRTA